ncbi:hypothetical protein PybrP1_012902 [[Pythium] brassicae (nom. inval.)]|nr:hypothetical protein PybrP1_012902 [[Pythium] brassicae (nom. inval.)]
MEAWVRAKVERLGLDADVYVEYGRGILEDEDTELAERVESVIAIFAAAAEGLADDATIAAELRAVVMVADVERLLHEARAQQTQQEEMERVEAQLRDLQLREQEKRAVEEALEREKEKASARQKMSREELAQREKLISEYGFSMLSEFDEDGNLVKMNDKEKEAASLAGVGQNTNKVRVQQAGQAMREKLKKEHDKKVAHEKELLEKDRLRKDKAKKRTVKREKQRGAGQRTSSAPQFAPLVLAALDAVGISYISMDHLRKAKRGAVSEKREYLELWKLLHDLVLVVLADFAIDVDEMRRLNEPRELEAALLDAESQQIRVELVRFYLYEWGFVCAAFYDDGSGTSAQPASSDLLLAISWLFAFAGLFERLCESILERLMGTSRERIVLPPYPNDVVLSEPQVADAVSAALGTAQLLEPPGPALAFEATIHRLHAAFGRLDGHVSELNASLRYHERLLRRLEAAQGGAGDTRLPAFVVQLFTQPKTALAFHLRLLAQRVRMIEDEKLFYKWVNGLVAAPPAPPPATDAVGNSDAAIASLARTFPSLHAQAASAQSLFQANAAAHQQLRANFERAYTLAAKSAARKQQLQRAMERVEHEVRTRELFDPQALFTQSAASWRRQLQRVRGAGAEQRPPLPSEQDLEALRRQLQHVLCEVTTEYCGAQLR